MTRTLLCNPPFYRLLGSRFNANSLGLAYVARKFNAHIYNADFSDEPCSNLSDIFRSEDSYLRCFKDVDHPIWEEVVGKILEYNPEMVGYTCYTANVPTINIIAEKIRREDKSIKQIVGGSHLRLKQNADDFSEYVSGVCGRVNTSSFPEREKFWGLTDKQKRKVDNSYIITSLGCPYKCTFCANPKIWNSLVIFRPVDVVIAEMREMKYKLGINEFYILDDVFTLKTKRARELLLEMKKLRIKWKCNTRLDCLSEDVCRLMKESGCVEAKVGVETGSERMLKVIKKQETKEDMINGINLLKYHDIPITAYFMAGFPTETDEDLKETIEFAKEINIDKYSLSIFAPYYGSEIYFDIKDTLKHLPYECFYHQSKKLIANKLISEGVLQEYLELADD